MILSNRGKFAWYNPYYDLNTKEIWPDQQTSTQANNTTTKTLWLQTIFNMQHIRIREWMEWYYYGYVF